MGCRVLLEKHVDELIGAFAQHFGRKWFVSRGHLEVNLVFQLNGSEGLLALDTRRRKVFGNVLFKMKTESEKEKNDGRHRHNQIHEKLVIAEIAVNGYKYLVH